MVASIFILMTGLSAERATLIILKPANASPQVSQTVEILEAHLADLPLQVTTKRVRNLPRSTKQQLVVAQRAAKAKRKVVAVCWFAWNTTAVSIFVPDPSGGRIITRSLGKEAKDGQQRAVAIAAVISTIVKTPELVSVPEPDSAPKPPAEPPAAEPPAPPKPPAPPPRPEEPLRTLSVGVQGGLNSYAPEQPILGAARFEVTTHLFAGLHAHLAYRWTAERSFDQLDYRLEFASHLLEVGASWAFKRDGWFWEAGLSVLVEHIGWSVQVQPEIDLTGGDDAHWVIGGAPHLGLSWYLTTRIALTIGAGVDFWINPHRYGAVLNDTQKTAVAPWVVRPWAYGGLRFYIF